jgi:hypothetical protein
MQSIVIALIAIAAIIVNVSSQGGANTGIAAITIILLVISAILMELQKR